MGAPAVSSRLVNRRDYHAGWVWELRGQDGHVLNRSERSFASREECEGDAIKNGQILERKTTGSGSSTSVWQSRALSA